MNEFEKLVEDYRAFEELYDPFGYGDAFGSDTEEATAAFTEALLDEKGIQATIERLTEIAEEDDEYRDRALNFIERIKAVA